MFFVVVTLLTATWFASRLFYLWRERRKRFARLVRQFQSDTLIDFERRRAKAEARREDVPALVVDLRRYRQVRETEESGGAA